MKIICKIRLFVEFLNHLTASAPWYWPTIGDLRYNSIRIGFVRPDIYISNWTADLNNSKSDDKKDGNI